MANLPKVPLASAISGLIVAALILMTPNEIFEAIVVQTGLPRVLDAATPPLGARARIVTAAIFAVVIAIVAWGALSGALRERRRHAGEIEPGLPRLRRADAHPDAPPRRPIFAHDDLGAPLDLAEALPDALPDALADEGEARVARMRARFADPDPVIPDWREAVDELPADPEPEPAVAPAADPAPMELGAEAIIWEPQSFEPAPEETPVFATPLREPEPVGAIEADPELEPVGAIEADPEPEPAPPPRPRLDPAELESLSALVDRLELGLALRRVRPPVAAPANVSAHPTADRGGDAAMDGALREALDALQRLGR